MNINSLHSEARNGERLAEEKLFRILSERFSHFVHRRVWNDQDARDIVQEALMTIAKEYKGIEFQSSFSAWAYKVVNNKILAYLKKKRVAGDRDGNMSESDVEQLVASVSDPTLKTTLLGCLKKLNMLNQRHARVLNLKYQGYSTEDICHRLKVTNNALYILLHRARTALEICLNTGDIKR